MPKSTSTVLAPKKSRAVRKSPPALVPLHQVTPDWDSTSPVWFANHTTTETPTWKVGLVIEACSEFFAAIHNPQHKALRSSLPAGLRGDLHRATKLLRTNGYLKMARTLGDGRTIAIK